MEGDAGARRRWLNQSSMVKIPKLGKRASADRQPEAEQKTPSDISEIDETATENAVSVSVAASPPLTDSENSPAVDADTAVVPPDDRRPSRLGARWWVGIGAALLVVATGAAVGGYVLRRDNLESRIVAADDAAALQAAKDCVALTQAPDTSSMEQSERKIIDCGTDEYRSQAMLNAALLLQAYQAANVHVQVSDLRAAVERNNSDGTVSVLVAVRVQVANDQQQAQENGYRLRATMAKADGQFKIAKLDTVTR